MARIHQLLPVKKQIQSDTEKALLEARSVLSRPGILDGISRTYQPRDDDGDRLPSESKKVQVNAQQVIDLVGRSVARLFDVTATVEHANAVAVADVKVGDRILVRNAPVSLLLWLEKQVTVLEGVVNSIPTLDPAVNWTHDEASGLWKSEPVTTTRTKKTMKPVVLYDATDKHPAQVKEVSEDVIVGDWTTVQFSGALPATQVKAMRERLAELRHAVLLAREEANSLEVVSVQPGSAIADFVFKG